MTAQNTRTHGMHITDNTHARSPGLLRHSSAHRARRRAIEAAKVTTICARFESGFMDEGRTLREISLDLAIWAKVRGGSFIKAASEKAGPTVESPFGGVRSVQVFTVLGPVALPTTVKGWKLTKATAKDIAWAQKGTSQ